jgi:hypothetical protein
VLNGGSWNRFALHAQTGRRMAFLWIIALNLLEIVYSGWFLYSSVGVLSRFTITLRSLLLARSLNAEIWSIIVVIKHARWMRRGYPSTVRPLYVLLRVFDEFRWMRVNSLCTVTLRCERALRKQKSYEALAGTGSDGEDDDDAGERRLARGLPADVRIHDALKVDAAIVGDLARDPAEDTPREALLP